MAAKWTSDPRNVLRAGPDFDLAAFNRAATPGWESGKKKARSFMATRGELLSELQERLFAHGRAGGQRGVLLVIQGLDTAGKGGIVRHVAGMMDPQGLSIHAFKAPTEEERAHHYLWRIENALPKPGYIGVFDRSHYEDVLVVRVDQLADVDWNARYAEINEFERRITDSGIAIVKVALMVSKEQQGLRLMERLDRPDKQWKFSESDVPTRAKWDAYQEAYQDMLRATSTQLAPWYVIPADKKWYSQLAVTELLAHTLADLEISWPDVTWSIPEQRAALEATMQPRTVAAAHARTDQTLAKVAASEAEFDQLVRSLFRF